jgi:hypothetical protein
MLCSAGLSLASERNDQSVQDLPYGLALYEFFQDQPIAAITELDVGKERDTLSNQPDDAELLLGGLYYSYGLPNEAEAIFNQLIDDKTEEDTQNRIWFNLARVQYDRGRYTQALDLLSRIDEKLPAQREAQKQHLLTNLYIRNQDNGLAAESISKIKSSSIWRPYSAYNLGVALVKSEQNDQGKSWLNKASDYDSSNQEVLALLDSTHLALGLNALRQRNAEEAIENFNKIRLSGPLSNKALLGTGWAWSLKALPDQALNYWLTLKKKGQIDGATHEAILAIPYAIEQKGNKVLATQYYDQAARNYDQLLEQMDLIIQRIQADELITILHQQRLVDEKFGIVINDETLISTNTPYLYQLFASSDFQLEIKHYQELLDIQARLQRWQNELPVLQLMLDERKLSFEQKRPIVEQTTSFTELEQLKAQRDDFTDEVNRIEKQQDYLALAYEDEVDYLEQLEAIQSSLEILSGQQDLSEEQQKFRLLSGLLEWQISTDYPRRIWMVKSELIQLDHAMEKASTSAESLSQAAGLNAQKLADFSDRIAGQNEAIETKINKVSELILLQQQHLNNQAIKEIERQKVHIKQLRLSARYSLARVYDEIASEGKTQ